MRPTSDNAPFMWLVMVNRLPTPALKLRETRGMRVQIGWFIFNRKGCQSRKHFPPACGFFILILIASNGWRTQSALKTYLDLRLVPSSGLSGRAGCAKWGPPFLTNTLGGAQFFGLRSFKDFWAFVYISTFIIIVIIDMFHQMILWYWLLSDFFHKGSACSLLRSSQFDIWLIFSSQYCIFHSFQPHYKKYFW